MRQKLNENPVAQIAVVAVLLLAAALFLLKGMGGGEEGATEGSGEEAVATAPVEEVGGLEGSAPAAATSSVAAPVSRRLPSDIDAAYRSGETIVLLIYRPGGIDDKRIAEATSALSGLEDVALFTAPADEVARYSQITGPLGVNQAPALIVVRSRDLNGDGPATATVDYGFRSSADVVQAVLDAGYQGPELTYAPN
jgi:hypothetical protein